MDEIFTSTPLPPFSGLSPLSSKKIRTPPSDLFSEGPTPPLIRGGGGGGFNYKIPEHAVVFNLRDQTK